MAIAHNTGRTTIVNAAFLQEVKESNAELWMIFDSLQHLIDANRHSNVDKPREIACQFVDCLNELRDCIGLEFSLEETYGFIDNARPSIQFGVGSAESAKLQHRELYLQLHEICEQAEEAQYRGTIVRDLPNYFGAFEQFEDAFRAHEELESELIRCGLGVSRFEF